MPATRSQKQSETTTESSTGATSTESSSAETACGTVTTRTTSTEEASASGTAAREESVDATQASEKKTSRPHSSSGKHRRKELAKAREELLRKQVELAAARVLALEEETDNEDESDNEDDTIKEQMTSQWLSKSALALTMEPHNKTRIENGSVPVQRENETQDRRATETARTEPRPQELHTGPKRHDEFIESHVGIDPSTRRQDSFDYRELAAAITHAARAVQPVAYRSHELPSFNGASCDWLPFKTAFEESALLLSEQENLARLRRSLRGAAKEAAQCLFIGNTTSSEVMKLLASRFGRPDALVMAELNKLRALPRLTENPRDICIFASKIINVTATVRALNKPHYLYNAEIVRGVVEKIPSALRYRYYDFAAEQEEDQPDLITLSSFFEKTAERCGSFAPVEQIPSEDRREPAGKKIARSFHTLEKKPADPVQEEVQRCLICEKDNHQSFECRNFKSAEVSKRWDLAKQHHLCFRCLKIRKFRHTCKTKKCDINGCENTHHPLLHRELSEKTSSIESTDIVTSTKEKVTTALLKILPIQVSGPRGTCDTYALLDDGSTCTLIETAVAEKIGATGPPEPFYIEGVAGTKIDATEARRVRFNIRGRDSKEYDISARTMQDLHLSPQSVSNQLTRSCAHLKEIEEKIVYENGKPTVLLGQDNWRFLITHEIRRGNRTEPVASLTNLGWVLHGTGRINRNRSTQHINHLVISEDEEISMEAMMKEHFALESLGVEARRSFNAEEQRAIDTLNEKTRRLPAGGFETGLLWKRDDFTPPANYSAALRRLELIEKKLDRNEDLKRKYKLQMQLFIEKGYAELAPASRSAKTWYLPHFAVVNPQKPEKLRIVHDAAARTKGVSLNDMLLAGPDLLQSLPGVLMRFRQHPVAVIGDIQDMFMRITIIEEDRDMQRFLWREDSSLPPTEYRMKSVIFGATSSPSTAIFVKNRNAEDYRETHPEAVDAITKNHYVDDYLASFKTEEEAIRVSSQVAEIHRQGNFDLKKWNSNSIRVRSALSPQHAEETLHLNSDKILGMVWNTEPDTLSFNMKLCKLPADIVKNERTPTKREALKIIMSIYDPLGIATPVTIQAKKILQDVWRSGIGWDSQLHQSEAKAWMKWMKQTRQLQELSVPRCYPHIVRAQNIEIHTFVDASATAYAAVAYWRIIDENGNVHVALIAGKGRVAPLKTISIPRLELQAAVLGCRLTNTIIEEHDVKPSRRYFWSDSRTVLIWLRNGPRTYKPFVAHRIAEIAENTKTTEWRWVPTKLNVADDATRDTPHDFTSGHRWYRGPDFLYKREEQWPREEESSENESTGEERVHVVTSTTSLLEALPKIDRFSSWIRVTRVTARVLLFVDLLRKRQKCMITRKRNAKNTEKDPAWTKETQSRLASKTSASRVVPDSSKRFRAIENSYLQRAKLLWIRAMQEEIFKEEICALKRNRALSTASRLAQYSIFIDDEGIIRLRSRIAATTDISQEQKEPAVLDGEHRWTRLYIAWVHSQLHHGGFETTANEVRQQYWVLRLRYAVRTVVKSCQVCRINRAKPAQPSTGNHPTSRVAHHRRPFTYTGLDYFGPMMVTVGRTRQKRYGVLFTCLSTRAVHLELAGSLTTDSAIMALRRFIGRRGCPTELWSDQGTNLRGADLEMKKAVLEALHEESSVRFITWRFIPPSAPFMGGAWERLVRSVKTALQVTLNERAPKEEVLHTLLIEAEHTINSRPLTHVSTAAEDDEALTPNHFLLGGPSRVPLPGAFTSEDASGRREWRTSQRLADMFWARWVREYLPELQHRREPYAKGVIKLNDLVLIADGTLPRNMWPRGVVAATYPGPDGEVRAVDVRTTKGILRRPTKKLIILPVEIESRDH